MADRIIVPVDSLSHKPIELWRKYLKQGRISEPVKPLRLDTPIFENKIRFVCISDTHEKLEELLPVIPDGDILIHAGDFTNYGDIGEVIKFNAQIGNLPHKHKIVIAGNHEIGFEDGEELNEKQLAGLNMLGINKPYELLTNCTYLCDRQVELYGLTIYGAPWHSMPGYSFYRSRGHGDFNSWNKCDGVLAGCADLLNTVEKRVKPKYHVFGHIHQLHGITTNGFTTFINASICDHKLRTEYDPIIFDIPLPSGYSKE
ncbi:Metallophosphoesterase domain-containing protein 1 [Dirofilaria immitis]|nr:Metallophosphoesterase domain-containing protein 1 [Dirofilaria immitis]